MVANKRSEVIQHLRRVALRQDGAGLTDAQLLEEYLRCREEAALAALVRRHGAMVWGVCRRVLNNYHDAEDAFQATFLVFVRKAATIVSPELLANWLYGVAHQTALKARATAAKRKTRERQVKEMPEPAAAQNELWNDLQPLLDQELSRLSDKYRSAIVLCDLEGKTRKEAARQLGVPEGTVAARLARGRKMLALRLARHGLVLSSAALATVLAHNSASATVPSVVETAAIKAATLFAAGQSAAVGGISVKSIALMEGVLKSMFLTKLKFATTILLGIGLLGISWGLHFTRAAAPPEMNQEAAPQPVTEAGVAHTKESKQAPDGPNEKKVGLPRGPAPVQVLVSLTKDGKLTVRAEHFVAVGVKIPPPVDPDPEHPNPGPRILFRSVSVGEKTLARPQGRIELSYDLDEIQVFDTNGKAVEQEELPKLLKEETVAVATFGDQQPDPLHLRILKEGTLVFLLPLPPSDKLLLPDVKQAMYQKLGAVMYSVWFLRKQPPGDESKDR